MERKLLSHDMTFARIINVIILTVFSLVFLKTSVPWWMYLVMAIIAGQMIAFVFYFPDKIEFDDKNIYIDRSGGEITVDMRDINTVKITPYAVNKSRYMWKIKYQVNGIKKAARFYPDYDRVALDEFTDFVKLKNPDATIDYSTNTFDFDM
jgi:hypothetical protein